MRDLAAGPATQNDWVVVLRNGPDPVPLDLDRHRSLEKRYRDYDPAPFPRLDEEALETGEGTLFQPH
jgi:hypothetical protein